MIALIAQAERLLAGGIAVPAEARRSACWLARAALEDAVRGHLTARGYHPGSASMRSLLACLEVVSHADSQPARAAKHAWLGLSQASHHHAFELSPTVSEVRHLIGLVAMLIETLPAGSTRVEPETPG